MDWKYLLAYITGSVDQHLLLRNEYLVTENRLLRNKTLGKQMCKIPHSIGFSGGQLSSHVEGSSAPDCPLIHDARS